MTAVLVGIEVEEKNHSKKLKEKLVMKIKKTEGWEEPPILVIVLYGLCRAEGR